MFLFRPHRGGQDWWGHAGYWGTTAYTCPSRDVTVVAGHQRSDMPEGVRPDADRRRRPTPRSAERTGAAIAAMSSGVTPQQPPTSVAPAARQSTDAAARSGRGPSDAPGACRRVPGGTHVRIRERAARSGAGGRREQRRHEGRRRAVHAHGDHLRDRRGERGGVGERCAVADPRAVAAAERHPRARLGHLGQQRDDRLRLDDRRDRLDREQVGAGRQEHLEPRAVPVGQLGRRQPVVADVLGAVGQRRAVRPDRGGDQPVAAGLVGGVARQARPTTSAAARSRRGRGRAARTRRRTPGSWR